MKSVEYYCRALRKAHQTCKYTQGHTLQDHHKTKTKTTLTKKIKSHESKNQNPCNRAPLTAALRCSLLSNPTPHKVKASLFHTWITELTTKQS